jgi:hypothetical protein
MGESCHPLELGPQDTVTHGIKASRIHLNGT